MIIKPDSKCAVITAHPDDETLWAGGTILLHPDASWTIITICRKSDSDRAPKFFKALQKYDAQGAMGGAGIQSAQIIGNNGATEVIVGNLGPNAMNSLSALNIKIYQSLSGNLTVKDLVDLRLSGKLQVITSANVAAHAGMGGGMGGGRGGGRGGGMGGGGRRP